MTIKHTNFFPKIGIFEFYKFSLAEVYIEYCIKGKDKKVMVNTLDYL